jgi:four helix bundle protein
MGDNKIRSFEDLECWKACREIRNYVSVIIKKFPPEEKYALTDGMRRASRSTTENIAEGYGRYHFQENIQFCRMSRGSVYELTDQFITAKDDGYISEEEYKKGRELLEKGKGLLNGYINYLERAKAANSRYKKTTHP